MFCPLLLAVVFVFLGAPAFSLIAEDAFVAARPAADFVLPAIVFPGGTDGEPFDYEELSKTSQSHNRYEQKNPSLEAVRFLREGIRRMTGKELPVMDGSDKSKGIVLTTLANAPKDVQNDPAVQKALRNTGEDAYNANEAFFIRTEPDRILIVANTDQGFNHAVARLLESVGYEILGMGPNWIHVPDFHKKPLIFSLQTDGRPGFYIRQLGLTSGQGHGIGTLLNQTLSDPADETVDVSYNRWSIGTHTVGKSMPFFLGNVMQKYHQAVVDKMKELGSNEGFLHAPDAEISLDVPTGKTLVLENGTRRSVKLDLSVPFVREILLNDLKEKSEAYFKETHETAVDRFFVFGTEPEDGVQPIEFARHPGWYPEYLKKEGVAFGQPYVLNGFKGLDQPNEIWEPLSFSDSIFGFNNWLLREYDKWIDSLPPEQRVTADGLPKKEMVRLSLLSYNHHDVPPNFNLDPRIRVMVAGYPKHRGYGKWRRFASQADIAQAFRVLLPNEPSGDYQIPSISYYRDFETSGIGSSRLAGTVQQRIRNAYDAGFRAMSMETDLNFGKMGLEYYLYAKMLWNPHLTAAELDAIRDLWLQRAYGSAWPEMKQYYDFMAPENLAVNAPNSWAKAIRFIDAADRKLNPQEEPDAKRRIDDLKQYWYYYYLRESGQTEPASDALREFLWKGQMSYMTPMHMVANRLFKSHRVREIVGPQLAAGPAHYTARETGIWWSRILDFWKMTPVADFADTVLAGGDRGAEVDLHDLVAVEPFQDGEPTLPFLYHSASQKNAAFLTVAAKEGDILGFQLSWPFNPKNNNYRQKDLAYGISQWDPKEGRWQELVDETMTFATSHEISGKEDKPWQLAEARFAAPHPGTYRINLGYGGDLAELTPLPREEGGENAGWGFTFFETLSGLNQGPTFLYIPKGVRSLDLEVWGPRTRKKLYLHNGLPSDGLIETRSIDISESGTHIIALEPGEDGSFVKVEADGFRFPYFYSIPGLWAKSPSLLLVPRKIAESDGLTIRK